MPKTQGIVAAIKQTRFALDLARKGKVPPPFPPHVAKDVKEARRLHDLVRDQGRNGFAGIVQGEHALARLAHGHSGEETLEEIYDRPGRVPPAVHRRRGGRRMRKVAYYKGCLASLSAKELDSATQALAPKVGLELVELESVTCCGAGDIHEAEPDYYLHLNARILSYAAAEGVDTLLTVCNVCTLNLRQANFMLLGDTRAARAHQREPRLGRRAGVRKGRRRAAPALGDRRGRGIRAAEGRPRTRG